MIREKLIDMLGGYTRPEQEFIEKRRREELRQLKEEVNKLQELAESTPPDCKRGTWCGYCKYAKKIYRAFPLLNQFSPEPFTFCGKGDMCKSFEAVEKRD